MKIIKHTLCFCLAMITFLGCEQDDDTSNLVDGIDEPTNVSALVTVTQDNTGLVKITPLANGVASFTITYGDGSGATSDVRPGEFVEHTYAEGTYQANIQAFALNGKSTTITQAIVVSFNAPENLVVTIENDTAVSKKVNVTPEADFALSYEVDFGQAGSEPVMINTDETASFIYDEAGTYTITVTAFSAAIETAQYTEDFVVTEILQPLAAAPTPPSRADADVISMFSNAYELDVNVSSWRSDWSTSTLTDLQIAGNDTKFYADADFIGVEFYGDAAVDASQMDSFHMDFWSVNATTFRVKLVDLGGEATEAEIAFTDLPQNEWVSIDIPMTMFTDAGMTSINSIQQMIFSGLPTGTFDFFTDNVYFYRAATAAGEGLEGTWKMAPEAGALGIGPAIGDVSYFNCDADCVVLRACYYDDEYIFGADGSFTNNLGAESWIEGWQGGGDTCGAPVAPHDGSNPATYTYDEGAGTVTLNGVGAYIGLAKANNQGELPNVAVPDAITYNVTFIDANTIKVIVDIGGGVFWQYKLIREGAVDPLVGTWQMAPEAGALGIGPAIGDVSYFNCDADCVQLRACYYDDNYIFGADGSFTNDLGAESWIEGWQGGGDTCGAPVAPHDGSNPATYTYNASDGTVTLNGTGAYIGLAKANNQGELPIVAVPSAITYNISFENANTINVNVDIGGGVFWQYKLIRN